MREPDRFVRFHFPELAVRGAWVHLDQTYQALIAGRDYPAAVSHLLGQMASITGLLAGQLKHPGRLTFQMKDDQSDSPLSLLVIDCTDQLGLRGTALWRTEFTAQLADPTFPCLNTGEADGNARLMMTLDAKQFAAPWQSFVPLVGQSLSAAFSHYLAQSEQQPTLLRLAADEHAAAALFLQKMPGADEADADGWNRLSQLFATLRDRELLSLGLVKLLPRLFPEELISLAPGQALHHAGERNQAKIHAMLRSLGKAEVSAIIEEHGAVVVRDALSNQTYHLSAAEALALFDETADTTPSQQSAHQSHTLH